MVSPLTSARPPRLAPTLPPQATHVGLAQAAECRHLLPHLQRQQAVERSQQESLRALEKQRQHLLATLPAAAERYHLFRCTRAEPRLLTTPTPPRGRNPRVATVTHLVVSRRKVNATREKILMPSGSLHPDGQQRLAARDPNPDPATHLTLPWMIKTWSTT